MKKKIEAILWLLGMCGLLAFLISPLAAAISFVLATITFLLVGDVSVKTLTVARYRYQKKTSDGLSSRLRIIQYSVPAHAFVR